jgi:hypothetical protein
MLSEQIYIMKRVIAVKADMLLNSMERKPDDSPRGTGAIEVIILRL